MESYQYNTRNRGRRPQGVNYTGKPLPPEEQQSLVESDSGESAKDNRDSPKNKYQRTENGARGASRRGRSVRLSSPSSASTPTSPPRAGGSLMKCTFEGCDKSYKGKSALKAHITREHQQQGEAKFKCDICDEVFRTTAQQSVHMRKMHTTTDSDTDGDLTIHTDITSNQQPLNSPSATEHLATSSEMESDTSCERDPNMPTLVVQNTSYPTVDIAEARADAEALLRVMAEAGKESGKRRESTPPAAAAAAAVVVQTLCVSENQIAMLESEDPSAASLLESHSSACGFTFPEVDFSRLHRPIVKDPLQTGMYERDVTFKIFDDTSSRGNKNLASLWEVRASSFLFSVWRVASFQSGKDKELKYIVKEGLSLANLVETFVYFMEGSSANVVPASMNLHNLLRSLYLGVHINLGYLHGALYLFDTVMRLSIDDAHFLYYETHEGHKREKFKKFDKEIIRMSVLINFARKRNEFFQCELLVQKTPRSFLVDLQRDSKLDIENYGMIKELSDYIVKSFLWESSFDTHGTIQDSLPGFKQNNPFMSGFVWKFLTNKAKCTSETNLWMMVQHSREMEDGTKIAIRVKVGEYVEKINIHETVILHFSPDFIYPLNYDSSVISVDDAKDAINFLYLRYLGVLRLRGEGEQEVRGNKISITKNLYIILASLGVPNLWEFLFQSSDIELLSAYHNHTTLFQISVFASKVEIIDFYIQNFATLFSKNDYFTLFDGFTTAQFTAVIEKLNGSDIEEIEKYYMTVYWCFGRVGRSYPGVDLVEADIELLAEFDSVAYVMDIGKLKPFAETLISQKFIPARKFI